MGKRARPKRWGSTPLSKYPYRREVRASTTKALLRRLEDRLEKLQSATNPDKQELQDAADELSTVIPRLYEAFRFRRPLWFRALAEDLPDLPRRVAAGADGALTEARGLVHRGGYALIRIRQLPVQSSTPSTNLTVRFK